MLTHKQAAKRLRITVGAVRGIVASGKVKDDGQGLEESSWTAFEEEFRSRRWMLLISEDDLRDHVVSWAPLPAREITRRLLREGLAIGLPKGISGALRGWLRGDPRLGFESPLWVAKPRPDFRALQMEHLFEPPQPSAPAFQLMSAFDTAYRHLQPAPEDYREALHDPWFRKRHAELIARDPIPDADVIWEGDPPLYARIRAFKGQLNTIERQHRAEEIVGAIVTLLARARAQSAPCGPVGEKVEKSETED